MQHLDEGTIHSWLDGALSADEAARVEAHVQECPQCAAAVAEARGFIAASSRILTLLDNVPSGVVPVTPPVRARNWGIWRAAAAVLVVALGSFVVLRDRMAAPERPVAAKTIASDAATPTSVVASPPTVTSEQAQANARVATTAPTPRFRKAAQMPANAREDIRDNVGVAAGAAAPAATLSSSAGGIANMNTASEPQPIRIVGRPRVIGQIQTLYEVAPGDTVLLAEVSKATLESVVVTGISTTAGASRASGSGEARLRPQAKASAPADSLRKAEPTAAAAPAPSPPPAVATSNGITTLSWTDPPTGNAMKLSGRHTLVELLDIKRRIEQTRAAEAAKKKP